MAWLVRGDQVLASLEIPTDRRRRAIGLIGRDNVDGAMLLTRCRSVHSFGMKFDLDVAFLDGEDVVLAVVRLAPHRVTLPRWRSRSVVEATAGAFERWGVEVGQQLEVSR